MVGFWSEADSKLLTLIMFLLMRLVTLQGCVMDTERLGTETVCVSHSFQWWDVPQQLIWELYICVRRSARLFVFVFVFVCCSNLVSAGSLFSHPSDKPRGGRTIELCVCVWLHAHYTIFWKRSWPWHSHLLLLPDWFFCKLLSSVTIP